MDGNLKFGPIDETAGLFVPTARHPSSVPRICSDSPSGDTAKRLLDFFGSAVLLVAASPALVLIAGAIKLSSPGKIVFEQKRVGKDGKVFNCYKFRTMIVDAESSLARILEEDPDLKSQWESSQKLSRDPRVTRLGAFLRKTSLDELPQLLNVLKGEMSLVGPRPIVESEIVRYGRAARWYLSCRPGMTGLWQVKRNSRTSYQRRVAFDIYYAKNRTLLLDLTLLFKTASVVIQKDSP